MPKLTGGVKKRVFVDSAVKRRSLAAKENGLGFWFPLDDNSRQEAGEP
jgi:hypothetical protein